MDRNYKFLKFLFTGVVITTLVSCFGDKKEEENIIDLPDYNPKLEEAVGKYYFTPIKDEFYNRDDYKYLDLKKGDTLFLEIKKNKTYFFNKIYFNQAENYKNLIGNLSINNGKISINPDSNIIKIKYLYPRGFKKSDKTGLYYYYALSSPTDPTEYEYYIIYKKMTPQ